MRSLPGLAACLSAGAILAHAQQTPPTPLPPSTLPTPPTTFVSEVELVEVDVSVLDKDRVPVTGLTAADFTVLEDGKRRPVVTFAPVALPDIPSTVGPWVRTVAPDVVTNAVPDEGRLVVIMMDGSIPWDQQRYARAIGNSIVSELGPADLGAVVYSSAFKTGASPQNFTTDRARLAAAVNQPFFGMTSPPEMTPLGLVEAADVPSPGADPCRTLALSSMSNIAESLGRTPHRRRILFVIARYLSFQAFGPCSLELKMARERLFRALDAGNVTVHVLDPSGLEYVDPKQRPVLLQRQGDLEVLPERTGGRRVINTNGQADLVPAIFRESRSYYLLGFQPAAANDDGRFHEIDVKVNRRDVTVHARRGYFARVTRPAPPLREDARLHAALSGGLPSDGLSLDITTAPIAPNNTNAEVAVIVAVRPESRRSRIALMVAAFEPDGRPAASARHDIELEDVNGDGQPSEVVSRLSLKPGLYEVRAAVHERGTERTGSVYTYVDVPDFAKNPISLSALMIASEPAWPTASAGAFDGLLPIVPTTRRTFVRFDRVSGFLKIYQAGTPQSVAVTMSIIDAAGRVVLTDDTTLDAARLQGTPATADYRMRLPLDRLSPGEYLLMVEAVTSAHTGRRDVRFSVK